MNEVPMPAKPQPPSMSQMGRVVAVFTQPTRAFEDVSRNGSWWLPFVLTLVVMAVFYFAVGTKVSWHQVYQNNLKQAPKQAEQLEKLTPEQRASQEKVAVGVTQGIWMGMPVMVLVFAAIEAAVLLGTINFVFGGRATYWKVFSMTWYAGLPGLLKFLLAVIALFAGLDPESFNINNPAGTNLGYYLSPVDTPKALMALATAIDPVMIWTLVLMGIGLSFVAKTKRSSAYIAVFGWWAVMVLVGVGAAAAFS